MQYSSCAPATSTSLIGVARSVIFSAIGCGYRRMISKRDQHWQCDWADPRHRLATGRQEYRAYSAANAVANYRGNAWCPSMSPFGTFETCPPILGMSVHRGRPEVAVVRPNRREWPWLCENSKIETRRRM